MAKTVPGRLEGWKYPGKWRVRDTSSGPGPNQQLILVARLPMVERDGKVASRLVEKSSEKEWLKCPYVVTWLVRKSSRKVTFFSKMLFT